MITFETNIMTGHQVDEFISQFDDAIGTKTQTNDHGDGQFSVTCFELDSSELAKAHRIERKIIGSAQAT